MSRNYKFHNPEGIYFISFALIEWLDVFTRNEYNIRKFTIKPHERIGFAEIAVRAAAGVRAVVGAAAWLNR